jgi:hypothetical protein
VQQNAVCMGMNIANVVQRLVEDVNKLATSIMEGRK